MYRRADSKLLDSALFILLYKCVIGWTGKSYPTEDGATLA